MNSYDQERNNEEEEKKLKPTKINHTAAQEINNTVYYNNCDP